MSSKLKILLFFVVLVIPGLLSLVTVQVSFSRASSVQFCGSCHVMKPWFDNVTNPESDSLAAEHYKRRWIQHEQCFTCHSNYDFLGPIKAKINGMHHVLAFYLGEPGHIDLYQPFPNEQCLQCHLEAKGFREDPNHDPFEDILSGKDRCVDCHENLHGVEQEAEAEGADGGDEAAAVGEAESGDSEVHAPAADKDHAPAADDAGEEKAE